MTAKTKVALVTEHESFWLDVIRLASRGTDPTPTLKRTQLLRRLFAVDWSPADLPTKPDDRGGGLAALLARGIGDSETVNPGSSIRTGTRLSASNCRRIDTDGV